MDQKFHQMQQKRLCSKNIISWVHLKEQLKYLWSQTSTFDHWVNSKKHCTKLSINSKTRRNDSASHGIFRFRALPSLSHLVFGTHDLLRIWRESFTEKTAVKVVLYIKCYGSTFYVPMHTSTFKALRAFLSVSRLCKKHHYKNSLQPVFCSLECM